MTWILIITLYKYDIGAAVHTQEFNSEKACRYAAEVYMKEKRHVYQDAICVPKDYVNPNAYKPKYIKD